jgi:redox-sensitive bicupin YhaK (pirin superfamily)
LKAVGRNLFYWFLSPKAERRIIMIRIHDRDIRGQTKTGWLDSKHTFSFGHFMDPNRMGFRFLRVINDDIVIPGAGFDTHPHSDMEIITLVLKGALEHKDSLGTGSVIRPGEIQRMSAGNGILHSEFNPSTEEGVHLLQIWILPETRGLEPSYEQKTYDAAKGQGEFVLLGDRYGTDGAITIHQNVRMMMAQMIEGKETRYDFEKGRSGFLHVIKGMISLNGEVLKEGDGAEISDVDVLSIKAEADSEVLLFDMA